MAPSRPSLSPPFGLKSTDVTTHSSSTLSVAFTARKRSKEKFIPSTLPFGDKWVAVKPIRRDVVCVALAIKPSKRVPDA